MPFSGHKFAHVYIHVPFCAKKCTYCDFPIHAIGNSASNRMVYPEIRSVFVRNLIKEIELTLKKFPSPHPLKTLYFGGGTPSLLSPGDFRAILESLTSHFQLAEQGFEFSVENDPDSVTDELLHELKTLGATRLSLGTQTFHPKSLKLLNRNHSLEQTISSYQKMATYFSPRQLSLDLILGTPGESLADLEHSLREATRLRPGHLSTYILTVEEKTRLKMMVEEKKVTFSEDLLAEKYAFAQNFLEEQGWSQYEVSNYFRRAPPEEAGFLSQHNSMYWQGLIDFYGFGMGAASLLGGRRFTRPPTLRAYYDFVRKLENGEADLQTLGEHERATLAEATKIHMMGKLRTVEGVRLPVLERLFEKFGKYDRLTPFVTALSHLQAKNYPLQVTSEAIFVPKEHFIVLNSVLVEVFQVIDRVCR